MKSLLFSGFDFVISILMVPENRPKQAPPRQVQTVLLSTPFKSCKYKISVHVIKVKPISISNIEQGISNVQFREKRRKTNSEKGKRFGKRIKNKDKEKRYRNRIPIARKERRFEIREWKLDEEEI